MATLVLTAIGDDRAGLVDALASVIADHGGNWDRSRMAELAGKFAGIVMITVADEKVEPLVADLQPLQSRGLLDVTVERAGSHKQEPGARRVSLEVVGLDHPGIVSEISHALAVRNVSIEDLRTDTKAAPMDNNSLFEVTATLRVPDGLSMAELRVTLEALATDLMVDLSIGD